MLKKIGGSRKDSVKCAVCNSFSTGTVFFFCNSDHATCQNCQQPDLEDRREGGDFFLQHINTRSTLIAKNTRPISTNPQLKDLASGDHDKRSKAPNKVRKSKSEYKIVRNDANRKYSLQKNGKKEEIETIIEYKNVNFHDDKSSTSSLVNNDLKVDTEYIGELPKLPPNNHVCPRPVTCPVEECHKMIALDSVMLHFYFDHSKVPRMNLCVRNSGQIQLKSSSLSATSQCLGIFFLQDINEVPQPKIDNNNLNNKTSLDVNSIFLMGAKIQMDKTKSYDEKNCTTVVTIRNVYTQTELVHNNSVSKTNSNSVIPIKKSEPYKAVAQDVFDSNELLILWLCKLDKDKDSYSISLIRKDMKQGFSYIGEATHIRDEQTPIIMYQQSNCLIVNGTAVNKLLDENNHLNVLINVLE